MKEEELRKICKCGHALAHHYPENTGGKRQTGPRISERCEACSEENRSCDGFRGVDGGGNINGLAMKNEIINIHRTENFNLILEQLKAIDGDRQEMKKRKKEK